MKLSQFSFARPLAIEGLGQVHGFSIGSHHNVSSIDYSDGAVTVTLRRTGKDSDERYLFFPDGSWGRELAADKPKSKEPKL